MRRRNPLQQTTKALPVGLPISRRPRRTSFPAKLTALSLRLFPPTESPHSRPGLREHPHCFVSSHHVAFPDGEDLVMPPHGMLYTRPQSKGVRFRVHFLGAGFRGSLST